ncbi:cytochrome P450 [Planobispora longispora]|uniref:Cytochrome P450 n=1 Tax=Planobispora longispora TaxID=28887 RepID=A0A8J3RNE4_9ACTN|nr:cytochrome P450 [Planobispora longispora]GIH75403.1 cytochrome P450 [Planobispora longispora]
MSSAPPAAPSSPSSSVLSRLSGLSPLARLDHEARLYLAAHPLAYPLIRLLGRLGPVVRVPGLGVVVNDAAVARAVLTDERFRKDGPGSPGDLWTPVLGPSVLLNMEGPDHLALRRKLMPLFTPAYVSGLVADVLREPLEALDARLARGETVDLVDTMRVMAGAVICRTIGLGEVPEARARELFAEGERVVSMVSLRSRRLSDRQVVIARRVLDRIGDIAQAAYEAGDESTIMGRMRAQGLSAAEARGAAGAFFLTGTETVATFVPRLIALICDHGTTVDGPDRLDRVIDEAMRVTTPTPVMLRSVAAPALIGGNGEIGPVAGRGDTGVAVRPGDRVLIATHNCARAHGPFDPSRPHPPELRHLWFGAGPHFCIGYPLALAEIRAVASTVLSHRVRVVRRRAARGVLIPTYEHLWITAS